MKSVSRWGADAGAEVRLGIGAGRDFELEITSALRPYRLEPVHARQARQENLPSSRRDEATTPMVTVAPAGGTGPSSGISRRTTAALLSSPAGSRPRLDGHEGERAPFWWRPRRRRNTGEFEADAVLLIPPQARDEGGDIAGASGTREIFREQLLGRSKHLRI